MKKLLLNAVRVGAAGTLIWITASPVSARDTMEWSVSIGAPISSYPVYGSPIYASPPPVYYRPYPAYVEPAPVYYPLRSAYVEPARGYGVFSYENPIQSRQWEHSDRGHGYNNGHEYSHRNGHRDGHRGHARHDHDNRYWRPR